MLILSILITPSIVNSLDLSNYNSNIANIQTITFLVKTARLFVFYDKPKILLNQRLYFNFTYYNTLVMKNPHFIFKGACRSVFDILTLDDTAYV